MDGCVKTKLQGAFDRNNQSLFELIVVDLGFTTGDAALLWDYIDIPTSCSGTTAVAFAEFQAVDNEWQQQLQIGQTLHWVINLYLLKRTLILLDWEQLNLHILVFIGYLYLCVSKIMEVIMVQL